MMDELRNKLMINFDWGLKDYVGSCNRDENIVNVIIIIIII